MPGAGRALNAIAAALPAALLALLAPLLAVAPAAARPTEFGIFASYPGLPGTLVLRGDIMAGAKADLTRALDEYPDTRTLVLESDGGLITEALDLGRVIRRKGLSTYVPPDGHCASACALVWFSGVRRQAEGPLGVHRFASPAGTFFSDEGRTQDIVGQIIELLDDMNVPHFVLVPMLRTDNAKVHWFSEGELRRLSTGRRFDPEFAAALKRQFRATAPALKRDDARSARTAPGPSPGTGSGTAPAVTPAAPPAAPPADCSAIPDATSQALCRDPHLAGLDADLAARTRAATLALAPSAMPAFFDRQTAWERTRAACKGNIACLERAYGQRLKDLADAGTAAP